MLRKLFTKELTFSVIIHALIIAWIINHKINAEIPTVQPTNVKIEPIKSFLYHSAKLTRLHESKTVIIEETKKEKTIAVKEMEEAKAIKEFAEVSPKQTHKLNTSNQTPSPTINNESRETVQPSETPKKFTKQMLNAQIKNIDKYIPHKSPFTHERLQTKSIFNQNPKLVPKSTSLSLEAKEQQRKQSITHYGKDITIKKDSNGNCSMTQDLSSVGIEGVKATQYFKCGGQTQFEKNFSKHMKASMKRYQ